MVDSGHRPGDTRQEEEGLHPARLRKHKPTTSKKSWRIVANNPMWCCCAAFGPTTRGREHQRTTGEKARSCWRLHLRLDAIARLLHGPKRRCTSRLGLRQFFRSAVSSHPGTQRVATHGERCVPLTPTLARPRPKWLISRAPTRLILRPTGAAATTCAQPGDSSSSCEIRGW